MGTMLQYEQNDIDSYNSCVSAGHNMNGGAGYVVTAAYERNITEDAHPLYYSVVSVTIEDSSISEASDPVIVDDLTEYDFE